MVEIHQVGLYWRKIGELGRQGRTQKPCEICGRYYVQRLRVVFSHGDKLEVRNVCFENTCLGKIFGDTGIRPEKAGKVRENGRAQIQCRLCAGDARGGVWVGRTGLIMPDAKEALCMFCFLKIIDEQKRRKLE